LAHFRLDQNYPKNSAHYVPLQRPKGSACISLGRKWLCFEVLLTFRCGFSGYK
jgi:hypothetical protein